MNLALDHFNNLDFGKFYGFDEVDTFDDFVCLINLTSSAIRQI